MTKKDAISDCEEIIREAAEKIEAAITELSKRSDIDEDDMIEITDSLALTDQQIDALIDDVRGLAF